MKPRIRITFEKMDESEKTKMIKNRNFLKIFLHERFDWLVKTNDFNLIVWYFGVIGYVPKNISNREKKTEKVKKISKIDEIDKNDFIKRVNIDEDNTKESNYLVYVRIPFENNQDNEVNTEDNTEGNTKDNEDNYYIKDVQSNAKYTNTYSPYIFDYLLIVNMIVM